MMNSDDSGPPSSSVVRTAALAWHRDVRRALARGLRAASAARAHTPDANDLLHASAEGIAAVVRRQIQAETRDLAPVLEQLDAWGPQRLERLKELHEREQAAATHALDPHTDVLLLATKLEASIREIVRTLRLEEKELLDADLLDDSTLVQTKQFGG